MCLQPITLDNGIQVDCRKCWQCRLNRVDDIVGRSIAESLTSVGTHVVTLTYGRDRENRVMHNKAAKLEYRDVQNFLKRLRFAGYPVRFVVAGEYGGTYGRAHWHCVLNWPVNVPQIPVLEKRESFDWVDADGVIHDFWPHGFTYWEKPAFEKLRYALKYALKDEEKPEQENMFGMSRYPPLGDRYFRERAIRIAHQGLVPLDAYYSFSDVKRSDGTLRKFQMRYTTLNNFMQTYIDTWRVLYPGKHMPPSEFLEKWQDEQEKVRFVPKVVPKKAPVLGYVSSFQPDDGAKEWLAKPKGGQEERPAEKREVTPYSNAAAEARSYTERRLAEIREAAESRYTDHETLGTRSAQTRKLDARLRRSNVSRRG